MGEEGKTAVLEPKINPNDTDHLEETFAAPAFGEEEKAAAGKSDEETLDKEDPHAKKEHAEYTKAYHKEKDKLNTTADETDAQMQQVQQQLATLTKQAEFADGKDPTQIPDKQLELLQRQQGDLAKKQYDIDNQRLLFNLTHLDPVQRWLLKQMKGIQATIIALPRYLFHTRKERRHVYKQAEMINAAKGLTGKELKQAVNAVKKEIHKGGDIVAIDARQKQQLAELRPPSPTKSTKS